MKRNRIKENKTFEHPVMNLRESKQVCHLLITLQLSVSKNKTQVSFNL